MDAYHLINGSGVYRITDAVQCNIFRWNGKGCTACSGLHRQDAIFFQCAEQIPNCDGVASGGKRQQFTGHFGFMFVFVNENQSMDGNGAFVADMHGRSPPERILSYQIRAVNVDTTSCACYNEA